MPPGPVMFTVRVARRNGLETTTCHSLAGNEKGLRSAGFSANAAIPSVTFVVLSWSTSWIRTA